MNSFENGNDHLQPLLDRGGNIDFRVPGIYMLHAPLTIRSHTRLRVGPGITFRAAPRSLCSLIENEAFYGDGMDEEIEIVGGIWDAACDDQGLTPLTYAVNRNDHPYDPRVFTGKAIRFAHVRRLTFRDATVKDPVSYGVQIADAQDFTVRDIHFDYNCNFGTADGVHINGPAYDGVIENMHGITNDDMVSLTTVDEAHAEVTRGPIRRIRIDGVHAENGYTGVRLLSCGEELTDIQVKNVSGTYRHNAVCVTHHNVHPGERIWMDRLVIDGVTASKSDLGLTDTCFTYWERGAEKAALVWVAAGVQVGKLEIRNVDRKETTACPAPTIQLDATAHIDTLEIAHVHQSFACGQQLPAILNRAEVEHMNIQE